MSTLNERLAAKAPPTKKMFGIVAGQRLAGKTTIVGTLPGKTLLLQAAVLESGSESAQELAKKHGNELKVLNFSTIEELNGLLKELRTDTIFDNVVVDSLSAITDIKYSEPKVRALVKTDNWAAFREIGETATAIILALKELTYPEKTAAPKTAWLTCALSIKQDKNGQVIDVSLDCKGNVATSSVTKYGEAVVTVMPPQYTETGEGHHRLLTKTLDVWPARVDGVLKENNPGVIEPASLAAVLALKGN
jgi:hypothetical protein